MPKTSTHHHLYLNHQTWMFRFRWPKDVIAGVEGQKEFQKSLKTSVLQEAISERDILYAHCKKLVKKIRTGNKQEIEDEKSRFFRLWLSTHEKTSGLLKDRKQYRSVVEDEAFEVAVEQSVKGGWSTVRKSAGTNPDINNVLKKLGADKKVDEYMREVKGDENTIAFDFCLDGWIASRQQEVAPKTLDDGKLAVLKFKESFPYVAAVDKKAVRKWFDNLRTSLSQTRLKTYKTYLQLYWSFLKEELEHLPPNIEEDSFRGISFKTRKNGPHSSNKGWKPFPNLANDISVILRASQEIDDQQMTDLILVGMYTAMRIEEICMLKIEDVKSDHIFVSESKTEAGIRKVPIHSQLQQPLERMTQDSRDGYVISGLKSANKYGKRSAGIGKRFGRLKTKLGFGPEHVFHSIRKTIITIFEQKNVSEGIAADIAGHGKRTITYGVYSGGASMEQMKEALEKIKYD